MSLPFLVVHGALVWKALIVVAALGSIGLVRLAQRAIARRDARRAVQTLDHKTDEGVVRGKLGGGSAATLIAVRRSRMTDTLDHRGDALWIETSDGKVELDGAVRIIAGSHASAARNHLPDATPGALAESENVVTATLASVAPGDEVIAFGRLERTPGTQTTDYRADAGALVLRAPEGEPIVLAARAPRTATPRLAVFSVVALAAASGIMTWGLEKTYGEAQRKACWDAPERADERPLDVTNTHACALAAAMPGSRDNALGRLVELLERDPYRDRASLDRLLALAALVHGCDGEIEVLSHAERYDEMLTVAERCGDRRRQHIALKQLGRFKEAVAVTVPEDPLSDYSDPTLAELATGPTLVLAGRWNDAAAAALRAADEVQRQDTDGKYGVFARSYRCLAELLRFYGGEAAAAPRLRALAAMPDGAVCTPELLEVVPEAERPALLAVRDTKSLYVDILLDNLRWQAGLGDSFESAGPEASLGHPDDLEAYSQGALLWLAKGTDAMPPGTDPLHQAKLDEWKAIAAVIDGDLAKAHDYAAKAIAGSAADPDARYHFREVATLDAVIDLYRADAIPAYTLPHDDATVLSLWLHDFGGLMLRHGDPLRPGMFFGTGDDYKHALETAERGDGRPLAKQLATQDMAWWEDIDVMAVLPRVKTGRDALVRQLVWSAPRDHGRLEYGFPFSVAIHAAVRRSSLLVAGEPAEAARWNEIYQRYDQALRDHRKLIALAIWSN